MFLESAIEARLRALDERSRRRELRRETAVSFAHNDYLGLAAHPEIVDAGHRALRADGAGSRGSRLLGGNTARHEEAEAAIAAHFGAPAATFFSTGYLANLALLQALGPLADG